MTKTEATVTDWRTDQRERGKALRRLLLDAEVKQVDVAEAMDIHAPTLSEYLNARRRWPDDFEARFRAVVEGRAR